MGRITLYDSYGNFSRQNTYHSPAHRNEIMNLWKGVYGRGFSKMYYHINPETRDDLVDSTGKNCLRATYMGKVWTVGQSKVIGQPKINKSARKRYPMLDG